MGVSKNNGTPKSSILMGFSIIFTIHFGVPLFLETPIYIYMEFVVTFLQLCCMAHSVCGSHHTLDRSVISLAGKLSQLGRDVDETNGRSEIVRFWPCYFAKAL